MAKYSVSQPSASVVRVDFAGEWDAEHDSEALFSAIVEQLAAQDDAVTVVIVAGPNRPVYTKDGIKHARDVLLHDNLAKLVIVADDPTPAVTHMGTFRTERGMPRMPIIGVTSVDEVEELK